MFRKFVAAIGLVIAFLGVALFIGIGIYIWWIKAEVVRQTHLYSSRANDTLSEADHGIEYVQNIIKSAQFNLYKMQTQKEASQSPQQPVNPLVQLSAESASRQLAGSVERAHGAVSLASEAVVVADAALDVVGGDSELKRLLGVKPEQLDATRTALGNVSTELQRARDVLGFSTTSTNGLTTEQFQAVDIALIQAWNFSVELINAVQNARERVNEARHKVDSWAFRAAIGTSLISIFGLVGQLFMAHYFWSVLRRRQSTAKQITSAAEATPTRHSDDRVDSPLA